MIIACWSQSPSIDSNRGVPRFREIGFETRGARNFFSMERASPRKARPDPKTVLGIVTDRFTVYLYERSSCTETTREHLIGICF